jgi:hypothetical protein
MIFEVRLLFYSGYEHLIYVSCLIYRLRTIIAQERSLTRSTYFFILQPSTGCQFYDLRALLPQSAILSGKRSFTFLIIVLLLVVLS